MRKHLENTLELAPVDSVCFHLPFRDHGCTRKTVIKKRNLATYLSRAEPGNGCAIGLNTSRARAQNKQRSTRRVLPDDCIAGRKLQLPRSGFDQNPVVGGDKIQWTLSRCFFLGEYSHERRVTSLTQTINVPR